MGKNDLGKYAFLAVVGLSVLSAFMPGLLLGFGAIALAVLGLVVGALNVEKSETTQGILVAIAFPLIAIGLNAVPQVSAFVGPILVNLAAATAAAGAVVVVKAWYNTLGN